MAQESKSVTPDKDRSKQARTKQTASETATPRTGVSKKARPENLQEPQFVHAEKPKNINTFVITSLVVIVILEVFIGGEIFLVQRNMLNTQAKNQLQIKKISEQVFGLNIYQPPRAIAKQTQSVFQFSYVGFLAGKYTMTVSSDIFFLSKVKDEKVLSKRELTLEYTVQNKENHPYLIFYLSAPENNPPQTASYSINLKMSSGKVQGYNYCYRLSGKQYEKTQCP